MCVRDRLESERFEDLPLVKRQSVCLSLCHCLNWFRELVGLVKPVLNPMKALCVHVVYTGLCLLWGEGCGHEGEGDGQNEGHHRHADTARVLYGRSE